MPTHRFKKLFVISCLMVLSFGLVTIFTGYAQSNLTPTISTQKQFAAIKAELKPRTRVPIVLPTRIPKVGEPNTFYPYIASAASSGYELSLDFTSDCQGAGACTFGEAAGEAVTTATPAIESVFEINDPDFKPVMRSPLKAGPMQLARGITGYFVPYVCGANCSSSLIVWEQNGYRYRLGIKGSLLKNELNDLVEMANSAIQSSDF
jgi:hypothetical protein